MKADKQHSALGVIKKEQLKRRVFSVEFKAEVVRYKKAENLSLPECGRKFEVRYRHLKFNQFPQVVPICD